jgi:hypothetical protein
MKLIERSIGIYGYCRLALMVMDRGTRAMQLLSWSRLNIRYP